MITSYYTLRALVAAWQDLAGGSIAAVYSQRRHEVALVVETTSTCWTLRFSAHDHLLFRTEGLHRARRNVAALLPAAHGQAVQAIRLAERDRLLYLDLDAGATLLLLPFGPRANLLLVDAAGQVADAFRSAEAWVGQPAPTPRPAPVVASGADFEARWRVDRPTLIQTLTSVQPLLDRVLAQEVLWRADLPERPPGSCTPAQREALFAALRSVEADLEHPTPHLYERTTFSLIYLGHQHSRSEEALASVDEAVRVAVRRVLADRRFAARYTPLRQSLEQATALFQARTAHLLEALAHDSRADRYERWGHLLMASAATTPAGSDQITVPDWFAAGEPTAIPLDPTLAVRENAARYYDKARQTRLARQHAEERLGETERRAREAARLLSRLQQVANEHALDAFLHEEGAGLQLFLREGRTDDEAFPFRRFLLRDGFEVWVGRNAAQNEQLTFHHARPFDWWLHARGVAGSHVVLRLPHRQARPDKPLVAVAAALAAWFSKARHLDDVPVIVTQRKYVRRLKGAAPGAVRVERETVMFATPGLPA